MSKFRNSPALIDILRALSGGETLSANEIRARSGRSFSSAQQKKLTEPGYLVVGKAGRASTFTLTADGMDMASDELDGAEQPSRHAPDQRLGAEERKALFALLSPSLQVSYAEVKRTLGIAIGEGLRHTLADKGLVVVVEGPLRFELTEKGWAVAEAELSRPAEADDPPLLKLLHHHFCLLLAGLRTRGLGLTDMYAESYVDMSTKQAAAPRKVAAETVGARIIDAYDELVYEPGGWVSLTRLREHMSDVEREELDEVLSALFRDGRIKLIAEVNQKTLTHRDREAALHIVGDEKHLYAVG
ncbi:hypothetical protein [Stackebrandtia nassauensis]|uniref:Uncharacterized protein n=1 Tax=Stackebrandtia nassauensis (strain DSM 44728 / CIP 108903 / NRRL B-16338 / NBRC 102104 / LLR-40K-21) TaxID=446470 RepID=D3PZT3_STANL|nr:hypothetical protein [Stackebrandtia nassauensis]ADD43620.1 hypothetical protein Snas_3968 [Stackebrandtia nassauensis DSM 44728]